MLKKENINIDKGWVSTGELALLLSVPFSSVRSWIANDKIARIKRENGRFAIPIVELFRLQDEAKKLQIQLNELEKHL